MDLYAVYMHKPAQILYFVSFIWVHWSSNHDGKTFFCFYDLVYTTNSHGDCCSSNHFTHRMKISITNIEVQQYIFSGFVCMCARQVYWINFLIGIRKVWRSDLNGKWQYGNIIIFVFFSFIVFMIKSILKDIVAEFKFWVRCEFYIQSESEISMLFFNYYNVWE